MKRIALITLLFFTCSLTAPIRSHAIVPVVIAAAAIGSSLMAASVGAYYVKTGETPQVINSAVDAATTYNDYVWQTAYLAFGPVKSATVDALTEMHDVYIGKQAAVGAKIGDVIDYAKNASAGLFETFRSLVSSNTGSQYIEPFYTQNQIFEHNGVIYKVTGSTWSFMGYYYPGQLNIPESSIIPYAGDDYTYYIGSYNGSPQIMRYIPATYPTKGMLHRRQLAVVEDVSPTITPTPGEPDYPAIADAINSNPTAELAQDVQDIIKAMPAPSKVTASDTPAVGATATPVTLTQAEINQAIAQNAADVAQAASDAIAQIAADNPTDTSAQIASIEAAQAATQAEAEAKADDTETFSAITDSPFATVYNPGEFDIPTRFNTFLSNVGSSGLFSFSSDFFNSLPGGGSPVFVIEGGETFGGSHSIDLSETMTGGLAVAKAVLLVLFGFLSIRAIIMKR